MLERVRRGFSFANVMSVIAVFLALGGTAYAFHLGRNSVGPNQLKRNAVSSPKVKNNSLKGLDIRQSTLRKVRAANVYSIGTTGSNCHAAHPFPRGVSTDHIGQGICEVAFPRNISKCDASVEVDIRGVNLILLDNPSSRIVRFTGEGPKKLEVDTFNGAGSTSNEPFDLVLVC